MNFKFELGQKVNVQDGAENARIVSRGYLESIGDGQHQPYYNIRVKEGDGVQSIWESELSLVEG